MTLKPAEFSYYPPDGEPVLGLLHCTDDTGQRITAVGLAASVDMLREAHSQLELDDEMEVSPALFPFTRPGWPDEWDTAALGFMEMLAADVREQGPDFFNELRDALEDEL